ncbi:hypothetical protein ACSSS7_002723 [Eimeria intestinalis]
METASQLEPIGRAPWQEDVERFPYKIQGDVLMEQSRQRTRTAMSMSYIETAIGICRGLEARVLMYCCRSWIRTSRRLGVACKP